MDFGNKNSQGKKDSTHPNDHTDRRIQDTKKYNKAINK